MEAAVPWGSGRPALVDVTTDERMGRDPVGLRRVADALDLHIVMGCGRYREPWFEPELGRVPTSELADRFVAEIEQGVGGTGIRPGIIGELGADRDYLSPAEERVLRAGARAHRRTGLPITLHSRFGKVGLRQLDVLEEEGVSLGRVIVGHSDTDPDPDYHEALARRGAWVQFDTVRGRFPFTVERRVRYVLEARRRGFLDRTPHLPRRVRAIAPRGVRWHGLRLPAGPLRGSASRGRPRGGRAADAVHRESEARARCRPPD